MDTTEFATAVRAFTTAVAGRRWGEALRAFAEVNRLLSLAVDGAWPPPVVGGMTDPVADALAELEAVRGQLVAETRLRGNDPKNLDPATVMLIIQAVTELVKWFIDRRRKG